MSNLQILLSNLAAAHADAIHVDLLPLAAHPELPCDELTRDIEQAVQRHAERLGVRLPY
ncbi:hypothetical protein [Burkholderia sp. BCC1047]|uniref:hypothetical protein n=1 Tax=Burkholderia sp. BCC1047 TaxID=2676299 RepID=UPI00158D8149|nr:hypothetical protein [Burkholderia sp. BCC1047]